MSWFVLALFGALFTATYYAFQKKLLKSMSEYVLPIFVYFISAVILLLFAFLQGIPQVKSGFLNVLIASVLLNSITLLLYLKALKITDISLVIPILSFTPVFLIVTSLFMLGEKTSLKGIAGIMLIVLGVYLLEFEKSADILKPFKKLFKDKGMLYMLIVSLIFAVVANIDKLILLKSDLFFGWGLGHLFISIVFLVAALAREEKIKKQIKSNKLVIFLSGLFVTAATIFLGTAMIKQIVPYVIAIKRTSILFSVLYGMIFFKEKNILQRFAASLVMFVGILLIIFNG